jgi:hypothetical protein
MDYQTQEDLSLRSKSLLVPVMKTRSQDPRNKKFQAVLNMNISISTALLPLSAPIITASSEETVTLYGQYKLSPPFLSNLKSKTTLGGGLAFNREGLSLLLRSTGQTCVSQNIYFYNCQPITSTTPSTTIATVPASKFAPITTGSISVITTYPLATPIPYGQCKRPPCSRFFRVYEL